MSRFHMIFLAALSACSDYEAKSAGEDFAESGDPEDTAAEEPDSAGDTLVPDGWTVRATLPVADGLPAIEGAEISIDVVDSAAGEVVCTVAVTLAALDADRPDEPAVWTWWSPATVGEDPCAIVPATLGLGVGELHPDVRARLGADDRDGVADFLYGAYVQADDGAVYTFGYAGTEQNLAGEVAPTDPPADGAYAIEPLYLLPLP